MKALTLNNLLRYLLVLLAMAGSVMAEPIPREDFRKWKDASGKFEIDAKFVSVNDGVVSLQGRDGKLIDVPLKKLSPIDQGFVEGKMSTSGGVDPNNPFKEMEDETPPKKQNSSNSPSADTDSKAIKEWKVDCEEGTEIAIQKGIWNPQIGEQVADFKLKSTSLPGKVDFFEGLAESVFNPICKLAVLTFHISPPGKPSKTRMVLVDTELGKVLANAIGDNVWEAMAIHDDGEQIVVRNDDEKKEGQLGTVRLVGKTIKPIDLWTPYESFEGKSKEKVVRFARFINNDRLLTQSVGGRVVIWDFATRTALRRFNYHRENWPALTIDRKHLGFVGGDILALVNLDDENAEPSVQAAPGMNIWVNCCFSPSCKRLAAVSLNKLMIWDIASGETLFDGTVPGLTTNGKVIFPDEDFVMINNDKLVEFSSGIKLWHYQGYCQWANGKTVMIANEDKGGKMMEVQLPHPTAREMLKQAKAQSDLFVLKKGSAVSIDLTALAEQYRGDVEQSLKRLIQGKGFKYSANAKVSFKPSITGPSREAISYTFLGSFAVNKYSSSLSIMYDGKSIWSSGGGSNIPGFISRESREDAQRQLDESGQGPNLNFFNQLNLPDFLQKPSGNSGGQASQMIGSSKFTANGLSN